MFLTKLNRMYDAENKAAFVSVVNGVIEFSDTVASGAITQSSPNAKTLAPPKKPNRHNKTAAGKTIDANNTLYMYFIISVSRKIKTIATPPKQIHNQSLTCLFLISENVPSPSITQAKNMRRMFNDDS